MVWPKGEPQAAETQKMSFLILCLNTSCRLQYLFQRVTILPSIMFYLLCHYHKKCLSKEWFILTVFKSSMQSDKFDTRYSSLWWNYHSPRYSLSLDMERWCHPSPLQQVVRPEHQMWPRHRGGRGVGSSSQICWAIFPSSSLTVSCP